MMAGGGRGVLPGIVFLLLLWLLILLLLFVVVVLIAVCLQWDKDP